MAKKITIPVYREDKKLNTENLAYTSILKRIREKRPLPNVKKIESVGGFTILHVEG
jgi:hypothetical protein